MNDFKLKTESDNIFLVNLSDTGKFLSPLFFQSSPIYLDYSKKLKNIANVNPIRQKPKFKDDELVPYVGLPETDEHTQRIVEVVLRPYKEVKGRNIIYKNDILFARIEPSIFNKKYIFANDLFGYDFAFTSTEFYIIEQKDINIEYVFRLLFSDFVFNQIKGKTTGSTGRRRLDLDVFKNIDFPVIKNIDYVTNLYNDAYQKQQQKQNEANDLLKSIDSYLLNELGITLPVKNNSLENRIFTTSFNEIVNRLEPQFYNTYYKDLEKAVNNSKYKLEPLKNICDLLNGFAFKSNDYTEDTNTLNIRMSNIRPDNKFDTEYKPKFLPDAYYDIYKNYRLVEGDIIVAMTDMASDPKILGVPTVVNNPNNKQLLLNQRVGKIFNIDAKKADYDYLRYVLSSSFVKDYYNQQGARGVQINISRKQILSVKIPLPPKEKQTEIANHITAIRNKAKQLELEAVQVMTKAKAEVENIILGQ